jgi:hypothetical protein
MLGPRDGEVLSIVEPKPVIEVMIQPDGRHRREDEALEYDLAIYTLERNVSPGVFTYTYSGLKRKEQQP